MKYTHLKRPVKRIIYSLRSRVSLGVQSLCFGNTNNFKNVSGIMQRLKKKGIVTQTNEPLRGVAVRAVFTLTPEGTRIADEISKEIEEYLEWRRYA